MHFHTDPVTSAEHIPPKSAAVPYSGVSADMSEVRNGDSVPPIFTLVIRKPAAAEAVTGCFLPQFFSEDLCAPLPHIVCAKRKSLHGEGAVTMGMPK